MLTCLLALLASACVESHEPPEATDVCAGDAGCGSTDDATPEDAPDLRVDAEPADAVDMGSNDAADGLDASPDMRPDASQDPLPDVGADSGCLDEELCNGIDDDCDGRTDEGLALGDPCEAGEGQCRAAGVNACTGDGEVICDALPDAPAPEACNSEDDDCDGVVDEGVPHPCGSFVLTGGRLTWAAGTSRSDDGRWLLRGHGVLHDDQTSGARAGAIDYRLTGGFEAVAGERMEGR